MNIMTRQQQEQAQAQHNRPGCTALWPGISCNMAVQIIKIFDIEERLLDAFLRLDNPRYFKSLQHSYKCLFFTIE